LSEFVASVKEAAIVIPVRDNGFYLNSSTWVLLKSDTNQEHISSVKCKLKAKEEQSAIIPIGKALPPDGQWQKKSSTNGLTVNFGIDENGRKASFEISSERPYGLIIGDVRVGKSSLLHTIIFQLLANYSHINFCNPHISEQSLRSDLPSVQRVSVLPAFPVHNT